MPSDVTVEEIEQTYLEAWRLGLKAIAIYRDGCKRIQPLGTSEDKKVATPAAAVATPALVASATPRRKKLPDTRHSVTHKFSVAGHEGYITVGLFYDGKPGEISISQANLRRIRVPLPPQNDARRVLDAIGTALEMTDRVTAFTGSNTKRLTRLRQSSLKWAFEGRLVDQDPTDEPASVLLERIRAAREDANDMPARSPHRLRATTKDRA